MSDNVTHLPEPGVILDLDAAERPADDVKPPFVVKIEGRTVTFADPSELPWQDLAAVEAPGDLIRIALSREDRQHVSAASIPAWKFNKLMESYYIHYDLEQKIDDARRRAAFAGS